MSVTIALLTDGVHSYSITYTAGTLIADLVAGVNTLLTSCGWALHDAAAGTNAYVYKAVCKDGVTYKYAHLDFDTSGFLILSGYEDWDAGTHTGTNKCYNDKKTPNTAATTTELHQQIDLTNGGILYVSLSARWLWIFSFQATVWGSSTFAAATGICETTVIDGDTTPPFFWCNTGNLTYDTGPSTALLPLSFPRVNDLTYGTTGVNAALYSEWCSPQLGFASSGYNANNRRVALRLATGATAYDPRSSQLLVGSFIAQYNYRECRGVAYGLLLIPHSTGTWLDKFEVHATDLDYLYNPSSGIKLFTCIKGGDTGLLRLLIPR